MRCKARSSVLLPLSVSLLVFLPLSPALSPATAAPAASTKTRITLTVDASEAARKVLHARLGIPAAPGPLTLLYPKWLPGEHGPTGPIHDLVGLKVEAAGKPLAWRRDPRDMFAFHCTVPEGARAVEVTLDFLTPASTDGFSSAASASAHLAVVSWNHVLVYPRGPAVADIEVAASIRLPAGWKHGSALAVARQQGANVELKPVPLGTLIDSPLLAGAHLRTVDLSPGATPPHVVHVAADSPAALEIPESHVAGLRRLIVEARSLFGARHYMRYHFLHALSDRIAHFGLEHHESSDNRQAERVLLDDGPRMVGAGLLPHELVHSWNGKYRRPSGLATAGFHEPMEGELLWIYEGLTEYLGNVLTVRSSLRTAEQAREALALTAAQMEHTAGRSWRSLADTAVAAQILYSAPPEWQSWRRDVDFYPEGDLIWLDVDTLIRQKTAGKKSLDDFCRLFHGGGDGPAEVKPYALDDVVRALEQVASHDWRAFLDQRVGATSPHAPLAGLERSGWKLSYKDSPSSYHRAVQQVRKRIDHTFSIGILLREDGSVLDAVPAGAAAQAGVGAGMKLVAVNGRRFSPTVLEDAVRATRSRPDGLELLVENGDFIRSHKLKYRGGLKFPHLERTPAQPDLLGAIWAPQASAPVSAR